MSIYFICNGFITLILLIFDIHLCSNLNYFIHYIIIEIRILNDRIFKRNLIRGS
nr:MAG TPA: hypothetical protein [Bacteriophage sp.]